MPHEIPPLLFKINDGVDLFHVKGHSPTMGSPNSCLRCFAIDHNRVQLGSRIGHGNFGSVYKGVYSPPSVLTSDDPSSASEAEDPVESMEVAVKIPTISEGDEAGKRDFLLEARTIMNLRHENILSCIGICTGMGQFLEG